MQRNCSKFNKCFLSLSTDIGIGVENFMDCLDSGVHVCKLASLIHQRGLQAHREDPTLPGVSNKMRNIKQFFCITLPCVQRNVVATSRKFSLSMPGACSLFFLVVSEVNLCIFANFCVSKEEWF